LAASYCSSGGLGAARRHPHRRLRGARALVFGGCYALLLFLRHTIERRTWEAVFSEQPWQRPSDEPTRRERNG
jgi:hypothetical protein